MCLQFIQIRIIGQITSKMLRLTKSIQISEYCISFQFTRIGNFQVSRVGIHALHFLFHLVGCVRQINTVTQWFAHLSLSIRTRQTQTSRIVRQQDFGFYQRITINMIETTYNFTGLLNHRLLIFTHRNGSCFESGNISSLTDRISEEPYRDAGFKITHLDFGFHCRVTLQAWHCDQIHIIESQFAQFGNLRLDKDGGLHRVQTDSHIIKRHLNHILTHLLGIFYIIG